MEINGRCLRLSIMPCSTGHSSISIYLDTGKRSGTATVMMQAVTFCLQTLDTDLCTEKQALVPKRGKVLNGQW